MLQTKRKLLALWVVLIVSSYLFTRYHSHRVLRETKRVVQDSKQELVGSLTYIPNTEMFVLRLENRTKSNIAIVRHPHLYEVRVFDCSDKKITDMDATMERKDSGRVVEEDWVVLRPGEAVSFPVQAYRLPERNGKIEVSGLRADCVHYKRMSYYTIPDFVKKAHAKIGVFEGTALISL